MTVVPARLVPFDLPARGPVRRVRATAWLARLPRHIADRELRTVAARLGLPDEALAVREAADAAGPGNAVCIEVMAAHVTELFTAFGRRGVPAEQVAEEAAALAERYLAADVPAGEFLADQLLLPLAMAGGGSFRTLALSPHAQTNRAVIQQFLAGPIEVSAEPGGTCTVRFAKATETAHVQNG